MKYYFYRFLYILICQTIIIKHVGVHASKQKMPFYKIIIIFYQLLSDQFYNFLLPTNTVIINNYPLVVTKGLNNVRINL